jgi:glucokinase
VAAACVIGVDLAGTRVVAGVVDAALAVQHRAYRRASSVSRRAAVDAVVDAVEEAGGAAGGAVRAVGFGVPAAGASPASGVVAERRPVAEAPLRDLMAERLGLPVFLDEDAKLALLLEHRFGAARGARRAALLAIGTTVVGCAVVDGRLVPEALGEPSPSPLPGLVAGAARDAPTSALGRAVRTATAEAPASSLVAELAHDGDPAAIACLRRLGEELGTRIASIAEAVDPDVVVLGGTAVAAGHLVLGPARATLEAARPVAAAVVPARFGAEGGMLGAAVLAMEGVAA